MNDEIVTALKNLIEACPEPGASNHVCYSQHGMLCPKCYHADEQCTCGMDVYNQALMDARRLIERMEKCKSLS
jgi:hypothetical protein